MYQFGKWISKHRILVIIIATLLAIPSVFGLMFTKTNYDILSYLPDDASSIEGLNVIDEAFGSTGIGMLVFEDVPDKEIDKVVDEIKEVEGVGSVLWLRDLIDNTIPIEILPDDLADMVYRDEYTLVGINLEGSTAEDKTLLAVSKIKQIVNDAKVQYKFSGLSPVISDMIQVADSEKGLYIFLAVLLSTIVLILAIKSVFIPVIFLLGIGFGVLYNMGTNYFLGEISYITKSIAAVLQLGVTMDFSIFLFHRYEEERENCENVEAMARAIKYTATSVSAAALTTIASFLALISMKLTLGMDIGIVMGKGVFLGVICTLTILPALILIFDPLIHKYEHKTILPNFDKFAEIITKKPVLMTVIGIILMIPAVYGQMNTEVYYKIDKGLPQDMDSIVALNEMKDIYDMQATHLIAIDEDVSSANAKEMMKRIKEVEGVNWAVSYEDLLGPMVPREMLPEEAIEVFFSGGYERMFINSSYAVATDEVGKQIEEIKEIMSDYDENAYMAGEAPLTYDLISIADVDFKNVNILSILIVLIIVAISFKSISLPILLVAVIELAISFNMGIPAYTGTVICFISSIVIGCVQLGSTVDYAILLTSRFKEELAFTDNKKEAMQVAVSSTAKSIVTSALSFFAATVGVTMVSKIDIISSLTGMMARGALISMIVILCILPSVLLLCEPLIKKTTMGWKTN